MERRELIKQAKMLAVVEEQEAKKKQMEEEMERWKEQEEKMAAIEAEVEREVEVKTEEPLERKTGEASTSGTTSEEQEDIHSLHDAVQTNNQAFDQVNSHLQQLEQRPVTAPDASSSNTSDCLNALEIDVGTLKDDAQLQQTTTQQLEQQIFAAATNPSSAPRETTPKFDGQEIFCDLTKTDLILWFRKFELKLQLHHLIFYYAMLDRFVLLYFDDILVYSWIFEDHLEHLRRVLETLRRAKYKASRDKCEFVRQELEYLGHFVRPEGISPWSDKIQAIQEWSEPRNVTDIRSFLGLAGYYQRFIKGYSKIAAHLTKLQCEDRPFDFGEDAWESFLALKVALLSVEVLHIYDPLLPTHVTTDASGYGIGAVLEQHDGVDWHLVEYFSKKVLVVHSIDDAHKELLAFVHALKRWRDFLLGRSQFRWVTDNNPLVFYKTQDTVNSTIARWMTFINQCDFFLDHIPGKSNRFADALSWRPDHCTTVYSTFEIDDDLRDSFIRGY
ncbi:hypothetical protein CBR_g12990 [Chara braunii]|uniref:Reverse transcriptase/retrotransposon-derived protein RNase H-like domain-containing protein n=1 Tax=Chara braunii TaxID=69332 RepID=A0A388KT77_CHABU|nr:hypothetical protein CBR_g12990 [Chara braunii]|eukprot:GBG73271.1 hypothetical protein CBR_g12990 [Chara braunii]